MTDQFKDKDVQERLEPQSFKEKILADLEAATRARHQMRAEWQDNDSEKTVAPSVGHQLRDVVEKSEYVPSNQEATSRLTEKFASVAPEVTASEATNLEETQVFQREMTREPVLENVNLEETLVNQKPLVSREVSDDEDDLLIWQPKTKAVKSEASLDKGYEAVEEIGEEEMSRESRKRTNRVAAKISTFLVSIIAIIILGTAFFTYRYVSSAIGPLDSQSTDYIQVEIPSGSGNKLIGQILKENGVIKDATVFNFYTKFKNYSNFQSGYYNFQKSMDLDAIAKYLQEGGTAEPQRPVLGKIVIPEGYTLKQIAEAVTLNANTEAKEDKTSFSAEDFLKVAQDDAFITKMVEKYPGLLGSLPEASEVKYRLEGYLFPATYDYYEETTVETLIEQMLAAADANLSPYYGKIANSGMTVNQVLTMASLVEKEGATDDDREMIASVFYNRWNSGMPLQSNIAILYAMDKLGQKTTLAEDAAIDTSIDSPYNIYLNTGLMPGPVDSPGLSALLATINPASTKYYYFVADVTTGMVYFAETYEEHSANVEKYVNSKLN